MNALAGRNAATLIDVIGDGVVSGHRPHPPSLGRRLGHQAPGCLVNTDDIGSQDVVAKQLIAGLEVFGQFIELIPQRLSIDDETANTHGAYLAGQRQMIQILVDGDTEDEIERVAPTRNYLDRCWRDHGLRYTLTPVHTALSLHELVLSSDESDLFSCFDPGASRFERTATQGTVPFVG